MRPIDRQAAPRTYARYEDALRDLADRIGDYCSYCERYIETHLAVEHIQPKSLKSSLRTAWTNFLLACVNCNSCKGKRHVVLDRYFWPDVDNTLRCFEYVKGGRVVVVPGLGTGEMTRAQALIELVGLDRDPGHPDRKRRPTKADMRWKRRQEAWDKAEIDRAKLANPAKDTPDLRQAIAEKAAERGMFSIWMTVFAADPDMRRRLFEAFKGTSRDCFDAGFNLVKRAGGTI